MVIRLIALTASHQVEVLRTSLDQIALDATVWVKQAESMKSDEGYRVPLSRQAVGLLDEVRGGGLVFPGKRQGTMVNDRMMTQAWRNAGIGVPDHRIRSNFKHLRVSTTWSRI